MTRFIFEAQDSKISKRNRAVRFVKLADQSWGRKKSVEIAQSEGIQLSDEHWIVIVYLRRYYLKHGHPIKSLTLENDLNEHFSAFGGMEYLSRLFPGGPVTQGNRIANLVNL